MPVYSVKNVQEFSAFLYNQDHKPVIVDFSATWCGPCRTIAPVYVKYSDMAETQNIIFLKVDVDEAADVAELCNISSMPTFQAFIDGQKKFEFSGANIKNLEAMINSCIQSS